MFIEICQWQSDLSAFTAAAVGPLCTPARFRCGTDHVRAVLRGRTSRT